jgi:hypothetical protein
MSSALISSGTLCRVKASSFTEILAAVGPILDRIVVIAVVLDFLTVDGFSR